MKTHSWLMGAAMGAAIMSGCTESIGYDLAEEKENDRQNEYFTAWLKTFGQIPEDQDWCMIDVAEARISTAALGDSITTEIYSTAPAAGGHVKGVAMGDAKILIDVAEGTSQLYAVMRQASGDIAAEGYCTIADGVVAIDPTSLTPARESRYAHDPQASYFDAMIVCEDMGSIGDFDFNDIVLGLRRIAGTNQLKITPMAAGGKFGANVLFGANDLGEIHDMVLDGSSTGVFLNTSIFNGAGKLIVIDIPSTWTIKNNWKDIKLRIVGRGEVYDVKASDPGRAPQMMCLGGDFFWPAETKSIKAAYGDFAAWATGNYTASETTWIDNKEDKLVVPWQINDLRSWFVGTTSEGSPYTFNGADIASGEVYYYDAPTSCEYLFGSKSDLVSLDLNGSHFDTSSVTNMYIMFSYCSNLNDIDVRNWNTSNVTNMKWMFYNCYKLNNIDVSNWDTSNVKNMNGMFDGCGGSGLNIDVSNWDTSNVADMGNMFHWCKLLNIDVSNWNTSNVKNMKMMFHGSQLKNIDLSNWNTSNVSNMNYMFAYNDFTSLDLSNWNTSNVRNMSTMFEFCENLQSIDLSNFDTSNVTDMAGMFSGCNSLASIDVSNFNTSKVTSMSLMFQGCKMTSIDLSSFDTSKVTNMYGMFRSCNNLTSLELSNFDVSEVTTMNEMFYNCSSLTSLDLNSFNKSKVTTMRAMFYGCSGLTNLDLRNFCTSEVTEMIDMFNGCSGLTSLDLSNFDTSKVTTMNSMFSGCSGLTSLDLSNFDTSKVTKLANMFNGCSSLTSLDLRNFAVPSYKYSSDIQNMFKDCPSTLEVTCNTAFRNWCISKATTILLPTPLRSASSPQWHIVE